MHLQPKPFAKTLATLLSLCLLVSFATCFWMCSDHEEATNETMLNFQTASLDDAGCGEECPIISSRGVLPGKHTPAHTFDQVRSILNPSRIVTPLVDGRTRILLSASVSDPPLERLCVFRI